jgi:uncharacterized protein YndB with AHSA1/START domain
MTDWFELRPVGLEFLDEAPLRIEVAVETALPRKQVWAAFTDAPTWKSWFPGVRESGYPNQERPYGVGTLRTANVSGMLFEETILAWEEPTRWIYRIDRATTDLASAQVEATLLAALPGGGTRVNWILAADPRAALAGIAEAMPGILEQMLAEALRNLEKRVAGTPDE